MRGRRAEIWRPIGLRHLCRQPFELAAADVLEAAARLAERRLFVQINGNVQSFGDGLAHLSCKFHALAHGRVAERDERHDIHGAEARVRAPVTPHDRSCVPHTRRERGRGFQPSAIARHREDRPVVEGPPNSPAAARPGPLALRRRASLDNPCPSSFTDVRHAFNESHHVSCTVCTMCISSTDQDCTPELSGAIIPSSPNQESMSDPLRTDPTRANEPVSEADREAKIEQLLLSGLDHYFTGQDDQAINVWTRALFLDRNHARARAYIERARSALAERQRESEELLHNGVAAFDRGESSEARRLLEAAISQGAPPDEALAILDRLNRLEQSSRQAQAESARKRAVPLPQVVVATSRGAWVTLVLLLMVIAAAAAFGAGAFRSDWRMLLERPPAPTLNPVVRASSDEALIPRRGDTALARARVLVTNGRLRDALAALDLVRATDPQKADADRLRADIQKQLIELASISPRRPADKGDAHEP